MDVGGKKGKGGRPPLPQEEKVRSVHIKIPPALLREIKLRSEQQGVNQTQLILRAVRAYLDAGDSTTSQ